MLACLEPEEISALDGILDKLTRATPQWNK